MSKVREKRLTSKRCIFMMKYKRTWVTKMVFAVFSVIFGFGAFWGQTIKIPKNRPFLKSAHSKIIIVI